MELPDRMGVLRVDLSERSVQSERTPEAWRRRYIGGKGLGARYLYDDLSPNVEPLDPENILAFMLGPLSGYLPGEQRYAAITKSPLTGTFLDSYSGGTFPESLTSALGDHVGLLVSGQASDPVVLVVENGTARVEQTDTWGLDAVKTCDAFDGSVACIGPAGEKRVAYATIASDRADHHAGRGGAGAVMGSKQLKAVVARGSPLEPPPALAARRERDETTFAASDTGRWHTTSETVETVDFADRAGILASHGWRNRGFDDAENIGIEAVCERAYEREHDGVIPGGFRLETDVGDTVPRGATAMSLGAGLALSDFDAVVELGERCNRLGMDLISAGNAVAWAIRAAGEDLIDYDIAFHDPDGARTLLESIAARDSPLGDTLADGVETAVDRFGGGEFIPTVKQMTLPAYDPRGAASMALAYATSDRGACHRRARPVEREVFEEQWGVETMVQEIIEAQDDRSVRWSLVADDFAGEVVVAEAWLDAIDVPHDDIETVGERIWNLVRLFNVREGFDREHDCLPNALETGAALSKERFDEMLDAYYEARGWGPNGTPARSTLRRLDLQDTVDDHTPIADSPIETSSRPTFDHTPDDP
ncbi:aldehyde:ferredoxin oxidoreductase [Halogranum amylolyticum]|uniref:Aldehyde:ferredoxin oxidoreductase n=1 Tax=Halogranum amylolyticum TaxID=660520 RepID=A0A1H8VE90_9EURY|nr:aldehyde ferredoxin oxidoreductase C-terminal domain-containing protein [Halogranum amylolyticum]SEP13760.1 aldehyde:ferredoxin oxidoreductase [Halogranum amylolyticum]